MKTIRWIGQSKSDGSLDKEIITFTDDFESDITDFINKGYEIYKDEKITVPDMFPLGEFCRTW